LIILVLNTLVLPELPFHTLLHFTLFYLSHALAFLKTHTHTLIHTHLHTHARTHTHTYTHKVPEDNVFDRMSAVRRLSGAAAVSSKAAAAAAAAAGGGGGGGGGRGVAIELIKVSDWVGSDSDSHWHDPTDYRRKDAKLVI